MTEDIPPGILAMFEKNTSSKYDPFYVWNSLPTRHGYGDELIELFGGVHERYKQCTCPKKIKTKRSLKELKGISKSDNGYSQNVCCPKHHKHD